MLSPATALCCELLPAGAFAAHASDWERLNDAGPRSPFLSAAFIRTVLAHFGTPALRLAIARSAGQTRAMALLQPSGALAWTCFQPSQLMLAPLVSAGDVAVATLGQALLQALPAGSLSLSLTQLDPRLLPRPPDSACLGTLDYIDTGEIVLPAGGFAAYERGLSPQLRANLRKRAARASRELGPPGLLVHNTAAAATAFLQAYAHMESAGWKAAAGTAIQADDAQYRFYLDLLHAAAGAGELRLFTLCYGQRPAAMEIVLLRHETAVLLKTTHDESLRPLAPGQRLFHDILRWLSEHEPGIRRIETYGPLNDKQRAFTTAARRMYHINLYRHRLIAQLHRYRIGAHPPAPAVPPPSSAPLNPAAGAAAFFGSPAWFTLLDDTVELPGLALPTDTQPPLSLPLRWRRSGGLRVIEACANFYSGLYAPLTTGPAQPADIDNALGQALDAGDWDCLRLAPLDADSDFLRHLAAALQRRGLPHDRYFCFANWYQPTAGLRYADYLTSRPSRLRNTLARAERRLLRAGTAACEIIQRPGPALEEAITAFARLYLLRGRRPEPFPDFVPELCRRTAAAGQLRLGLLRLDGRAVAAQIWIVHAGSALIFKLAYDPACRRHSVGSLLTARLMQHVIDTDRVDEVDYLVGDEAYKRDWMSARRERIGLVAFNPRSLRGLAAAARHYGGRWLRHTLPARPPPAPHTAPRPAPGIE